MIAKIPIITARHVLQTQGRKEFLPGKQGCESSTSEAEAAVSGIRDVVSNRAPRPAELWVIPVTEHLGKTHLVVEPSDSDSLHIINSSVSHGAAAASEAPAFTF